MTYSYNLGDTIRAKSSKWANGKSLLTYSRTIQSQGISCRRNFFNDSSTNYIGIRLSLNNDTVFGWIRVTNVGKYIFSPKLGYAVTIQSFALNKSNTIVNLENQSINNLFIAYPNPNNGSFKIVTKREGKFILYDLFGNKIQEVLTSPKYNFETEINGLKNGMYLINGLSDGKIINQKIIVSN
jgi:hypothetical protein